MSTYIPNSPALLDSTGQVIVQKLQGIINALGGGGTVIIEEYDSSVLRYPNTNEDAGLTYKVGDYCSYNNSIYFCNTAITWNSTTPPAFDSTKWYDATDDIVKELSKKPGLVFMNTGASGGFPEFIDLFGAIGSHIIYNGGHSYTHVEGYGNKLGVQNDSSKSAQNAHAEGSGNTAAGYAAHVEGEQCKVTGRDSHAEGNRTEANGQYCHAEGYYSIANGDYCHAEGNSAYAYGDYCHAEGYNTYAYGNYAHVEGYANYSGESSSPKSYYNGAYGHVEGYSNRNYGQYCHAEGYCNYVGVSGNTKYSSHVEGQYCNNQGNYSHVEGNYNYNYGDYNHVEGSSNYSVYGSYNHVEGGSNNLDSAGGCQYNHIEGQQNRVYKNSTTNTNGYYCHAEGVNNYIYGGYANHAEGNSNYIYGPTACHVEGQSCYANTFASHAGGQNSQAGGYGRLDGAMGFAHGMYVQTYNVCETAFGYYNDSKDAKANISPYIASGISYTTGDKVRYNGTIYEALEDIASPAGEFDPIKWDAGSTPETYATNPTIFSVGNGTANNAKSNAFEVLQDGTGYLKNNKRIITTEEVPDAPVADGTYTLQVTVSNGQLTYAWV